ncbi:Lipase [Methylophaga frappieri]|uniref:Lipase n=2 Tax=Methylophaga frappieri (strain ATCC BAA-2434 / DSM 25690 / JAM7) TaxID=754477 RepID=I1YEH9_METFJ|nr:Lipase [Methylophaga frappieri]
MDRFLQKSGFETLNLSYPSRRYPIEQLATNHVLPKLTNLEPSKPVHFVTHSMGAMIVRCLARQHPSLILGHVVMLAPPNQGSEIVDRLAKWSLFSQLIGPAGQQLSTHEGALPAALGKASFNAGIIAGDRAGLCLFSRYLPKPHDGKVSVASTKLVGMCDSITVRRSHTFIMNSAEVQQQTHHFLKHGQFKHT